MTDHVTKLFLAWHEETISEQHRTEVSIHLEQCSNCRTYFEKMSAVFDDPSLLQVPGLQANPHLPARILALRAARREQRMFPIVRWSLTGVGTVIAVLIGIYLGSGLTRTQTTSQSGSELSEYHDVIAQHGLIDQWDSESASALGDKQ